MFPLRKRLAISCPSQEMSCSVLPPSPPSSPLWIYPTLYLWDSVWFIVQTWNSNPTDRNNSRSMNFRGEKGSLFYLCVCILPGSALSRVHSQLQMTYTAMYICPSTPASSRTAVQARRRRHNAIICASSAPRARVWVAPPVSKPKFAMPKATPLH